MHSPHVLVPRAHAPKYASRFGARHVHVLESKKRVLTEQARESGKPDNVIEKMIVGRMQKFYKEQDNQAKVKYYQK